MLIWINLFYIVAFVNAFVVLEAQLVFATSLAVSVAISGQVELSLCLSSLLWIDEQSVELQVVVSATLCKIVFVLSSLELVHFCNVQLSVSCTVKNLQVTVSSVEHKLHLFQQVLLKSEIYVILLEGQVDHKHVGPSQILRLATGVVLDLLDDFFLQLLHVVDALTIHEAHADQGVLELVLLLTNLAHLQLLIVLYISINVHSVV